jgi:hypothetical protein
MQITSDPAILKDKEINWVDMHHHSTISDGNKSPHELFKWARKNKKGLCITDHNKIQGSIQLSKQKEIFTIPSIEVTPSNSKDILAYFYHEKDLEEFWKTRVKKNILVKKSLFNFNKTSIPLLELLDSIKDYNGISILAHPLTVKPKNSKELLSNKEIMKKINGIESHNQALGKFQKTKKEIAHLDLPQTAGTDSHTITNFNTLTGSYSFDRENFLKDILQKKNSIFYSKGDTTRRIYEQFTIVKNNILLKNKIFKF